MYFLFNCIIRNIYHRDIFAHFFIGVYIIVFFDRIIYIYFSTKELWFPRLKYYVHYAETAAHSAYERNIFARFTWTWRNLPVRNWSTARYGVFLACFAKRKRETESKVQIELGIRIRGNFHESEGGELWSRRKTLPQSQLI